jgi:5-hydroxyisourate hydrolase
MTTLSTHVLDVERGCPAAGVSVALFQGDDAIARGETNAEGRIGDLAGGSLASGVYRLVFDIAPYFAQQGRAAPFLQQVAIDFRVDADDRHYHVPLLLSPYACTSYRGG